MTTLFEFATASRIVFGRGEIERLGRLCAEFGNRAMVIRGGAHLDQGGIVSQLTALLTARGVATDFHSIHGEPNIDSIEQAVAQARAHRCNLVVGLGGGSALDAAKAVAGLVPQDTGILDHLEVIGRALPLKRPALPVIAVPTTAGTGSEVTKNAVIASPQHAFKASLRSTQLFPRVALVDPALTDGLPQAITASTGLDALTQLIEPYVSLRSQPLTDAVVRVGLGAIVRSLERAVFEPIPSARDDMALASLCGGIALANSGLGAVHGFAAPLGAALPIPHGVACAALLPGVTRINIAALRARAPNSPALPRYAELGRIITGKGALDDSEAHIALVDRLQDWVERLVGVSALRSYGLTAEWVPTLAARAKAASSMRGNPLTLTDLELEDCLRNTI